MERWQLEVAESELRVAESLYRMARNREERLDAAGKVIRARAWLETAREKFRQVQADAACIVASAAAEHCNDLVYRPFLAQARQSRATFLVREAADDSVRASDYEAGWSWPVRVMESGRTSARVEGFEGRPTYVGAEVLPQIASAINGARFRRRHPDLSEREGFHLPELTIGWMSNGRVEGQAVYATAHLLHNEREIREKLMAAREAGQLDLFGVSVMGSFNYTGKEVDGTWAHVATNLVRFIALDMVAEPGAGGRFLPIAAGVA
jgi:hypothetical protein